MVKYRGMSYKKDKNSGPVFQHVLHRPYSYHSIIRTLLIVLSKFVSKLLSKETNFAETINTVLIIEC